MKSSTVYLTRVLTLNCIVITLTRPNSFCALMAGLTLGTTEDFPFPVAMSSLESTGTNVPARQDCGPIFTIFSSRTIGYPRDVYFAALLP